MTIRYVVNRPSPGTPTMQWTGSNVTEIRDFALSVWGWDPQYADTDGIVVDGDKLYLGGGGAINPGEWIGIGTAGITTEMLDESMQDVPNQNRRAFVFEED